MGKISYTKLFLGAVALGVSAATAYTFVKRYQQYAPKALPENAGDEVVTPSIDRDAAKRAADETIEIVKTQAGKAFRTLGESAKAVGGVISENYGEEIGSAKKYAGEKFDAAKEYASEKFAEAKEYAGEKFTQAKEYVQDKYRDFADKNPKVAETIENVRDSAERTYQEVKEKVADFFDSAEKPEDTDPEEEKDPVAEAVENAEKAAEDALKAAENTTGDFIQNL